MNTPPWSLWLRARPSLWGVTWPDQLICLPCLTHLLQRQHEIGLLSSVVKYFHVMKTGIFWRAVTLLSKNYIFKVILLGFLYKTELHSIKKIVLLELECVVKHSLCWAHYSRYSTLHLCLTAFFLLIVAIWKVALPAKCLFSAHFKRNK